MRAISERLLDAILVERLGFVLPLSRTQLKTEGICNFPAPDAGSGAFAP